MFIIPMLPTTSDMAAILLRIIEKVPSHLLEVFNKLSHVPDAEIICGSRS